MSKVANKNQSFGPVIKEGELVFGTYKEDIYLSHLNLRLLISLPPRTSIKQHPAKHTHTHTHISHHTTPFQFNFKRNTINSTNLSIHFDKLFELKLCYYYFYISIKLNQSINQLFSSSKLSRCGTHICFIQRYFCTCYRLVWKRNYCQSNRWNESQSRQRRIISLCCDGTLLKRSITYHIDSFELSITFYTIHQLK